MRLVPAKEFPQSGFQYGVIYIKREEQGPIKITDWRNLDGTGVKDL